MFVKRLFIQLPHLSTYVLSARNLTQSSTGWATRHLSSQILDVENPVPEYKFSRAVNDINEQVNTLLGRVGSKSVTADDWREFTQSYQNAKDVRMFLQVLTSRRLCLEGKSYIEMLQKYEPQFITPFTEVHIVKFLSVCGDKSDVDKDYIENVFKKVTKSCPILDSFSRETLISAMQGTSKWRESLTLFDNALSPKVSSHTHDAILFNFLKEDDIASFWKWVHRMKEMNNAVSDKACIRLLEVCRRTGSTEWDDVVGRLVNFFCDHHLQISTTLAEEIVTFIKDFNPEYVATKTDVRSNGECLHCSTRLRTQFSVTEHNALKGMMEKIFLRNKSLFSSTTPREMERFKNAVSRFSRYNCVIDGLNVLHCRTTNFRRFIKYLKRQYNAQILFLGRQHLAPLETFSWIKQHVAYTFLCDNQSVDDAFVLYAAIYHRSDVKFVSNDFFRSQLGMIEDQNSRNLFLRWRYLNQIHSLNLEYHTFLPEIHKSKVENFHIPCVDKRQDGTWHPATPVYWLCLQRNTDNGTRAEKTNVSPELVTNTGENEEQAHESSSTDDWDHVAQGILESNDPGKSFLREQIQKINERRKKRIIVKSKPTLKEKE